MRFIHILFNDASQDDGWIMKDDWKKGSLKCSACGIVIHEDNHSITIALSVTDDCYLSPLTIPLEAIIEMWDLEAK